MTPSWITIAWSMMAGASAAGGVLSLMAALLVPRQRVALLAFSVFSLALTVFIVFELGMLRATTPEAYGLLLRWSHLPLSVTIIASMVFLRRHFNAGRNWLLYAAIGARLLAVAANFLADHTIHFLSITELKTVTVFGGELVAVAAGVRNPWQVVGTLSALLYFLFVLDATLGCWRRRGEEDRRRAVLIGGGFLLFIALAAVNGHLIVYGVIVSIYTVGVPFVIVALAITGELGFGLLRARRLAERLALSDAERRQRAQHLAQVAQAAKLGTWELDTAQGKIVASEQTRALLGIPTAEPIALEQFLVALRRSEAGAAIEAPDADEAYPDPQQVDSVLQAGGAFEVEHRLTLPDGHVRWVHSRGESEVDARGRRTYLGGITFDVTELREAQEQSRLVLEAATFAIIGVDRDGRIVLVNKQAESLFGYPRIELHGTPIDMLIPLRFHVRHGANVARTFKALSKAKHANREVAGRRKDGSEVPLQVGLSVVQLDSKPMVLASIVDLTDRKRAEQELEQQRSELSHLSRVTMLGELSGSLAHELNQPLAAILGNAQAALRFLDVEQPDLDEVREILRDIVSDDKRAGDVIRGLRLLLKRGEMRQESIGVNEVVQDVLRLLNSNTVNANVQVSTDLAEHLPPVTGDRVQLQQVVLNLVMNACDAMGGTPVPERLLRVTTALADDSAVQICVIDQGAGIAPELLERMFDPFVTTRAHGLGLGLSVCRQIVLAHHGRLWAVNNPVRGAAVCFALPRRAQEAS